MLKAFADLQATKKLSIDLDLVAVSSAYARGNENNLHQPDGVVLSGAGHVAGLRGPEWRGALPGAPATGVVRADQQPARPHYYTAAQLGTTGIHGERQLHRAAISGGGRRLPAPARHLLRAGRAAGGLGRHKDQVLMLGSGKIVAMLWGIDRDLAYAVRALRKTPGFALAAIALLAVGIGGTAVRLQPCRHAAVSSAGLAATCRDDPHRLVTARPAAGLLLPVLLLRGMARAHPFPVRDLCRGGRRHEPQEGAAAGCCGPESSPRISSPLSARCRQLDDCWARATNGRHRASLPAVLSYEFWHTRFHGSAWLRWALCCGSTGSPSWSWARFPRRVNGIAVESGPAIWVPLIAGKYLGLGADPKQCCQWGIGGRLRPGVTLHQAEAETIAALHAGMMAAESRNKPLTAGRS